MLARLIALVALALALGPASAAGQGRMGGGAAEHVTWTAAAAPRAVAPGGAVRLTLRAEIADGWKMYALDSPPPSRGVRPQLDSLAGLAPRGAWTQAEPKAGYDPNFDKEVRYFEGAAALRRVVGVGDDVAAGARAITGRVEFMICNDRLCLPPTRAPFEATVAVDPGAGAGVTPAPAGEREGGAAAAGGDASGGSDYAAARGEGLWGFLLLAIGAGAAALLTPCVFPMIPLTVSYFTKHAGSRAAATRMALAYGLTIVLTFTGLGVLMAVLVGAAGAQTVAANPWVNLFIGVVFVAFALSLLGLFDLSLPSGVVNYVHRRGTGEAGYLGVFFMGLTLTLVSFSCTAPFVGGLLAATAGGTWLFPVVGMLAFSATFALPFVGFALFPKGLSALPKSGSWMRAVKVTLGFVELAAALKFLSNADLIWGWGLLSRPLAIALTVVIFALAGFYLLGTVRLKDEPPVQTVGSLRLLAAMGFLGLALYLVPGLLGAPLGTLDAYLPPRQAGDMRLAAAAGGGAEGAGESAFDWVTDDPEAALERARAAGQPLFIDFTGYTCTNCRAMEANVFPVPAVAERLRGDFVLLRLYTDDRPDGPRFQRYQLRLTGTTALPTYAVVDPVSEKLLARHSGTASPARFAAFLTRAAAAFGEGELAAREE